MGRKTMPQKARVDRVMAEIKAHNLNFSYETMTLKAQNRWFNKQAKLLHKLDDKLAKYIEARGR